VDSRPDFGFIVLTPAGVPDPSLAIAGSRAGALGVLNLEFSDDRDAAIASLERLTALGRGRCGVLLEADAEDLLASILAQPLRGLDTVILTRSAPARLEQLVDLIHRAGRGVYLVATGLEQALAGQAAGVDAVISKGNEAGGWVGEETGFVLLQRLLPRLNVPVWAHGGVGLHTAAACYIAGAAGAVLDSQLLLARESPLTEKVRARISTMDGSETVCPGAAFGAVFRAYARPDLPVAEELRQLEAGALLADQAPEVVRQAWRRVIRRRVDWQRPETSILAVGQDAAIAAGLARRFGSVGGILEGLRQAIRENCSNVLEAGPLAEGSALAQSHRTRYPIVQGPMTRVSDKAEFAAAVAGAGALPFLALALMRAPEVRALLEETRQRLGDQPWGVGILGFVPPELRAEQLEVIRAYRPPFALIAGGRPDQSRILEKEGIATYLHVPSPGLLRMFLQDGVRRFVFEGRECGGHVGPRTSFVLWETMIDVLIEHLPKGTDCTLYHVLFAGGVHDALSAAMVAALAAPLVRRGVRIGVLLGTAYLFTREAVQSGAIVSGFQGAALECQGTVLIESGPGHATRCVASPFVADFAEEKRRLIRDGLPPEELRQSLEALNIGRLRVAAKGVDRDPRFGQDPTAPKLVDIGPDEQWARGMYMIGQVAALRQDVCTLSELHQEVSDGSTRLLAAACPPAVIEPPTPSPAAVAIVGMACILPGAPELKTFWSNILNKVDAITEVPADRWDWQPYFDPARTARDKIYSRWGGFIGDVPFDPALFGMPPSALPSIEPFQLLALAVVRAALGDARYLDRPFPRDRTSVILGAGGGGADLTSGYMVRSSLPALFGADAAALTDRLGGKLPEWTEDSFPGVLMNVAAGRVANRFDLGGVNYTVDAACASSLAAIYLAVRDLEAHTSDVVIVGGVDAIQNPFAFLCFSKTQALSPNGRCRTFDAQGDGIAISEGFAALILKRLEDAERDGDRIYAVIRGVGGSSDGRDRSMTAPRPEGQIRALRRAYAQAGFPPTTVGLIEAHGTGTVAGDQAEIQALTSFFDQAGAARQSCAVGSIKSMIGHTKATAGVAGLIKVALSLNHRVLPPTLGVTRPNPKADFPASPFYVNTETRPWIQADHSHPRRAGVSAFGFGGTNFHVALEEYTGGFVPDRGAAVDPWPAELLVWRGRSRAEILAAITRLAESLERGARPRLTDLAYTTARTAVAAEAGQPSLAIVADSLDDFAAKLRSAQELLRGVAERGHEARGIHFAERPLARDGRIAFLFPGQGSQYVNMARELAVAFEVVRECFERADRALTVELGQPLSSWVFPAPVFGPDEERRLQAALTETSIAQPALGAAGLAFLHLLGGLGVEPQMVAGHSFGEFVALCAAGCFSEETLLQLAAARGRFMRECTAEESGAMAAVVAAPQQLEPLLAEAGLTLANLNAPRQTVISGTRARVERAIAWCSEHGLSAQLLGVACAFHSPLVAPARDRLAGLLRRVPIAPPRVPVYSNTTAAAYPDAPAAIAELLGDHLVRPVEFVREVEAMYEAGARLFVEVGPRNVLSGLVGQILGDRAHVRASLDGVDRPGVVSLLHGLAALFAEGVPVRAERLFEGRSARRLELSELAQETGAARYSPTTWLVNGGRARPAAVKGARAATPASPLRIQVQGDAPPPTGPGVGAVLTGNPSRPSPRGGENGRPSDPSTWDRGLDGNDATKGGMGACAPRPFPTGTSDEGGTMTQSTVERHRVSLAAPPAHEPRDGPPAFAPPAPAPPGPSATTQSTVDLARQFQQVMMRFLQTQETVMHDLLAFLGTQGVGPPVWPERPRALGGEITRNGSTTLSPASAGSFTTSVAPRAHIGPLDGTPIAPGVAPPSVGASIASGVDGAAPGMGAPLSVAVNRADHEARPVKAAHATVAEPASRLATDGRSGGDRPSRQQLTERLLAIVSERTGYPEELLALDADLEADLGIDSIKRVEIAGTLIRSLELPPGESPDIEKLTGSRTLGQVIENLESLIAPASGVSAAVRAGQPELAGKESDGRPFDLARTGQGVGRFALKVAPAPAVGTPAGLARTGAIVIVDDERGVGRRLAERLGSQGYQAVRIVSGVSAQDGDAGLLAADLCRPDDVIRLVGELRARHGPAVGLIHLPALRRAAPELSAASDIGFARPDGDLTALFLLAQALRCDLEGAASAGGAAVLAATAMGGSFAVDSPAHPVLPGQAGLAGFLKALAHEWPSVRVKAVDCPHAPPEAVADWLLAELMLADGLVEVGYRDGHRIVLEPVPAPLEVGRHDLLLDGNSVVLVTGGARGITARAALALAETARPTLLVVGRTSPPEGPEPDETAGLAEPLALRRALLEQLKSAGKPITATTVEDRYGRLLRAREVRDNLAQLRQTGARVDYFTCDVRDTSAFGSLIDDIYQNYGRIDGVIHGAGVIEDRLVKDKQLESLQRVVDTKVNSALVLAGKLRPESLRFLVFFSSVTGRFGNRGQADYAAASEVLNKLAQDLNRRWPARVASINWGPWLESGMASPDVQKQFAERGVVLIPPDVGCRMLVEELRSGRKDEVEVLIGGATGPAREAPVHAARAAPTPRSYHGNGECRDGQSVSAPLPPLLATVGTLSREDGTVEVLRPLNAEDDLYLRDHCLDGQPVLPFAMAMELMAEVAAAGWPGMKVVEVRQIRLLRGIVVGWEGQTVRVVARPRPDGPALREGLDSTLLLDLAITSAQGPRRVHYQAVVALASESDGAAASHTPEYSDFDGVLEGAGPLPIGIQEAYRDWLFHGPLFQAIVRVEAIGPRGARAILRPSSAYDCLRGNPPGEWLIDPVLVDSALQMQVLWARLHWDVTLLPAGIEGYRAFGPLGGASPRGRPVDPKAASIASGAKVRGIRYELRIRPESQSPICNADHSFSDLDGRLLGLLVGVEGTGSKALNRLPAMKSSGVPELPS
jgi:acyl transferase domain-containing protein/NAD(P)H-dependent flavin oxidoreductase YrpB (nitropropane dioxygenase family)/NAD(P)-dependent dehydrogenase (short-subunit alcohol dehydrogenase family)